MTNSLSYKAFLKVEVLRQNFLVQLQHHSTMRNYYKTLRVCGKVMLSVDKRRC